MSDPIATLRAAAARYVEARKKVTEVDLATPDGQAALKVFQSAQSRVLALVRELGEQQSEEGRDVAA